MTDVSTPARLQQHQINNKYSEMLKDSGHLALKAVRLPQGHLPG